MPPSLVAARASLRVRPRPAAGGPNPSRLRAALAVAAGQAAGAAAADEGLLPEVEFGLRLAGALLGMLAVAVVWLRATVTLLWREMDRLLAPAA